MLEPRVRGSVPSQAASESRPASSGPQRGAASRSAAPQGPASGATELGPLVRAEVRKALAGSVNILTQRTKEVLTQVVQAVVFESGIIDKVVERAVEKRLQGRAVAGATSEDLKAEMAKLIQESNVGETSQKDLRKLVDKQVATALSSEEIKVLIDDKFRAITLYLKQDVIPRAVRQVLKQAQNA